MEKTIAVKGKNPIDLNNRIKACETINQLSDKEVKNLMTLVNSEKARSYLASDIKFMTLKAFM